MDNRFLTERQYRLWAKLKAGGRIERVPQSMRWRVEPGGDGVRYKTIQILEAAGLVERDEQGHWVAKGSEDAGA